MKTKTALTLLSILLTLSACGNKISQNTAFEQVSSTNVEVDSSIVLEESASNNDVNEPSSTIEDTEITIDNLEITEYSYENTIGDTLHFLIIKNLTDKTLHIGSNTTAYDASGAIIGAASSELQALGSNCESILIDYFDSVSSVDHFEYLLSVKEDPYYTSVIQDLDSQLSIQDNKVIISCTNTGEEAAKYVNATVLFFKEGRLTYYGSQYITDTDYELKAGSTLSEQVECYNSFDDVKVVFSGYR